MNKNIGYFLTVAMSTLCCFSSLEAVRPHDVIPDQVNEKQLSNGTSFRKGTIAATVLNAALFDKLIKMPNSPEKDKQITQLINDQKPLMVSLKDIGFFEFVTPLETLQSSNGKEGKALIGVLYLQQNPTEVTPEVTAQLKQLLKTTSPELQKQIRTVLDSK